MTAVKISDLSMTFGAGTPAQVNALDHVNADIAEGEFISLIGPSGCGKSTMLRLIGDLLEPTSGGVEVFGKPSAQARLDRDYGMVFQQAGLFDWRTVSANVELPLELMGHSKADRSTRSRQMLELVELGDFGKSYPWQLSGGMQQRVAIARALSFSPRLLLMDEPFGALDEMTRENMQTEVLRIHKELGTTIIFVTHSIAEAVFLSNRVIVLSPRPGRIHSIIDVELGRRDAAIRESAEFFKKTTEVREALRGIESGGIESGGIESGGIESGGIESGGIETGDPQ